MVPALGSNINALFALVFGFGSGWLRGVSFRRRSLIINSDMSSYATNGAGKTTTLRSILALRPAWRGRVIFNGTDITGLPTYRIVKSGIAFVPEDRGIFPTVTVEEHLAIAYGASKRRPRRS
jgi:ABC-type branched-subunit amino acid transport system ATPase component